MRALTDPVFDAAGVGAHLSDEALLAAMLAFLRALAEAEEAAGLVPAGTAAAVATACDPARFDAAALGRSAADGGNPAIPLVAALRREVARIRPEAAPWVHFGATSQDVWDSARMVCTARAVEAVEAELDGLLHALAHLLARHGTTVRVARTLLRHALPTTLALELATVADGLLRVRRRLAAARREDLAVQLGGAAGTRALLGARAGEVVAEVARRLGLAAAALPWHVVRDRVQHLAALLTEAAGIAAKWLGDVALAMQDEVGELAEPARPGKGASSALPHKLNPVDAARARAAFLEMPGLLATLHLAALQEGARGLGAWHAEWRPLARLCVLAGGILRLARTTAEGLEVDAERMRANLEAGGGLVFAEALRAALLPALGAGAGTLVEELCRRSAAEGRPLAELARAEPAVTAVLDEHALAGVFDPGARFEAAAAMVAELRRRLVEEVGDGRG